MRQAVHIRDVFSKCNPTLSFEYFPPKTKIASEQLFETIKDLSSLSPSFVSVTYGAGGTTRELTHDLVSKLSKETDNTVVAHLTCVGATKDQIKKILENYRAAGICNVMALRGDPALGSRVFEPVHGGFKNAGELVAFIKKNFPEMGVGVAGFPEGHPECPNRMKELDFLKAKVDQGADYICTQLFFSNPDFYDFRERCLRLKIDVPIIAGLMPISSISGMERMAELALGARIPAKLLKSIDRAESSDKVSAVGIHWATEQARDLLDQDVRGIHFYTLNRSLATRKIYENLGISSGASLQSN